MPIDAFLSLIRFRFHCRISRRSSSKVSDAGSCLYFASSSSRDGSGLCLRSAELRKGEERCIVSGMQGGGAMALAQGVRSAQLKDPVGVLAVGPNGRVFAVLQNVQPFDHAKSVVSTQAGATTLSPPSQRPRSHRWPAARGQRCAKHGDVRRKVRRPMKKSHCHSLHVFIDRYPVQYGAQSLKPMQVAS